MRVRTPSLRVAERTWLLTVSAEIPSRRGDLVGAQPFAHERQHHPLAALSPVQHRQALVRTRAMPG